MWIYVRQLNIPTAMAVILGQFFGHSYVLAAHRLVVPSHRYMHAKAVQI